MANLPPAGAVALAAALCTWAGVVLLAVWFFVTDRSLIVPSGGLVNDLHRVYAIVYADSYFVTPAAFLSLAVLVTGGAFLLLFRWEAARLGSGVLLGAALIEIAVGARFLQLLVVGHRLGYGGPGTWVFLAALVALLSGAALSVPAGLGRLPRPVGLRPCPVAPLVFSALAGALLIGGLFLVEFTHSVDPNSARGTGAFFFRHYLDGGFWIAAIALGTVAVWLLPAWRLRLGTLFGFAVPLAVALLCQMWARNVLRVDFARDAFGPGLGLRLAGALVLIGALVVAALTARREPASRPVPPAWPAPPAPEPWARPPQAGPPEWPLEPAPPRPAGEARQ